MLKRVFANIFVAAFIIIVISGCSSSELEIEDAWARPASAGQNSAVYFVIKNHTLKSDSLLSASTDIARAVELHESTMSGEGMHEQMQMVPQDSVSIPFLRKTVFKQGGLHVMLIDLQQDLKPGDSFNLTLNFKESDAIILTIPVKEP